ncbi:MAG: glycogen debranching N-terminal domain-containing protein [Chloroflexota bacterium]
MSSSGPGSLLERTVLKEGQLYLVTNDSGDVVRQNAQGQGLYYRDTRHLSVFELNVEGVPLMLLSASGELNFMSTLQLANDRFVGSDERVVADTRTISVRRNRFLHEGLHERIGFVNYNQHPVRVRVRVVFGSDFRDMFDIRGYYVPEVQGEILPIDMTASRAILHYRGQDRVLRQTHLTFEPPPAQFELLNEHVRVIGHPDGKQGTDPRLEGHVVPPTAAAVFDLDLAPMVPQSITLHVAALANQRQPSANGSLEHRHGYELDSAFLGIRESYHRWRSDATAIETDHEIFDQLVSRALDDLRLLTDTVSGDLVPTAGIPWFAVPFGRDSLITGMQTLSLRPEILAGTLRFLAHRQGKEVNAFRDEQPGKILHEVRLGELARLSRVPHSMYYGSIDATPLFVVALGEYVRWTGNMDMARTLLPNAEAAMRWMRDYGDLDGDGFIEYQTTSTEGLRNQGWKDSSDSISYRDGELVEPPIALAEVQAYAFAAHREMAYLYGLLGEHGKARDARQAAERVRDLFVDRLAITDTEGRPFWGMGLDGQKRVIDTVGSNPGHALWAGVLRGDDARAAAERLTATDMLSGWGLRTLSGLERRFNPMSYHNGSIWPHDNALVALGLKRAGMDDAALRIAAQIFDAGLRFSGMRLPELWCGFSRDQRYGSRPAQYPVSCSPQAWAAGSAFMLLQAMLGLEAGGIEGVVRLRPVLPHWLGRVSYRRLRVGETRVDFDVIREGHRVVVDVLEDGGLQLATLAPKISPPLS